MSPRGFFLLILTLFSTAVVLFFQLKTDIWTNWLRQCVSRNYSNTVGVITHSGVTERDVAPPDSITVKIGKEKSVYAVSVRYRYEVGGRVFEGERFRYNSFPSSAADAVWAKSVVADYPIDSEVQVYYNPANAADSVISPGLAGRDVVLLMFMIPFNCMMFGLWVMSVSWLRRNLFSPVAGGVKVRREGQVVNVWLPRFMPSLIVLGFVGLSSFLSVFALGTNPSFLTALVVCGAIFISAIALYAWLWRKIHFEDQYLMIDHGARRIRLPKAFGRKERLTLPFEDVVDITTEAIARRNRGNITYTFAPTLHARNVPGGPFKLANWRERKRANSFTRWLGEQLGLNSSGDSGSPERDI
ncbi:MAG: DUF3592 domain-containing protein [Verrucomicrobia bacterium]|nr:DUF3592 domain-containing protein [Verrucomicrobiota bacterium]